MKRAPLPTRRSLRGLDWFTFFVADIQTGFGPFISVYLVTQKWPQTDIGLVLTIGGLTSLLCQIPGGAIVDSVRSERSAAAFAVVGVGLSAFMIAQWPIFATVAFAQMLHSASSCVLGPAIAAITLGLVAHNLAGERFGRNARFASLGNGFAAGLMGVIGHFFSAQAVFFVTAAMMLPALLALFHIREFEVDPIRAHGGMPPTENSQAGSALNRILPGLRQLLSKRAFWVFILCVGLFQIANTPMLPLVGSALTMRFNDTATMLVAICIVLPQLIVAIFSPSVGRLAQKWGRRPLFLIGLSMLPIRGIFFAFNGDPIVIVVIQMLDGISASTIGVLYPLVIADIARGTGRFNLALGIAGVTIGFGAALSTTAVGYLTDHFGSRMSFLALAGVAALAVMFFAILMPETRPSDLRNRSFDDEKNRDNGGPGNHPG